jgi:hypothetical protein
MMTEQPTDQPTELWLTVAEAARSTGLNAERLRSLARRGSIECRRGNAGLEVHIIDGRPVELRSPTDRPRPSGRPLGRPTNQPIETDRAEEISALKIALAVAEERARHLQERLDREQGRADKAEAEAATLRDRAASAMGETTALRDALADLSRRLDTATAALVELRKPWWQRLLGR